jgi:hypothetical protein
MRTKLFKSAAVTLLPAAMLAFTSCSSTPTAPAPPDERGTMISTQPGVPGGVRVDTYKTTATVTDIDAGDRTVTLVSADGTKATYTAGPEVVNFNQIRVGDHVKATVTAELAVFLRKSGEPATDGGAAAIALAPVGAKPGGIMAKTAEITAKVTAIDLKHQTATLQLPDGRSKTFKVRNDVDLTRQSVGQEVVIRMTQAIAVSVEKP